jgi:hypothetical protein
VTLYENDKCPLCGRRDRVKICCIGAPARITASEPSEKELMRWRKRARKLEQLLIEWLGLEERCDQAKTDEELSQLGDRIKVHCARVRRALFR